jgi:23S rRNA (uracil1939-C5)-methyltransferase
VGKKKQLPFHESVEVLDVGAEGKSIARINDKVVFLTKCVPGDLVDIQITRKRKNYLEGRITAIKKYSQVRSDPVCEHFGTCGGCKWQNLPYDEQLKYKEKQVEDQLARIGKLNILEISQIIESEETLFYRNKLEYTFSNKRWLTQDEIDNKQEISDRNALGFHIPGLFDKVLDINKCWLQQDPSNAIRIEIKNYAEEHQLEFFDLREQTGFLRNLIIRTTEKGETMVILSFFKENQGQRTHLLNHIYKKFPQISSLMYVINEKGNDTILDREIKLFRGRDYIIEEIEGLHFRISAKSFFQTNSKQTSKLYGVVKSFAGLTGKEVVYDLYTGIGTIASFIAKDCKKVIGIETVEEAIFDAKLNAELNCIENASFFAGDIKDTLTKDFIQKHGKPDVVILDPPRAGLHKDVVETLLNVLPERMVYVSCNPATQARDINLLNDHYDVKKVQPVDMFPHTHHVENVVQLVKSGFDSFQGQ